MADRERLKERVIAEVDRRRDELIALSLKIHANPEIAFEEEKAAAWLGDYLESEGFAVERGICRLPTAFRAEYGSGEPRVAIIAEYDALPGVGHGCGHNIIGTASAAAGLAAKAVAGETGGTVLVIGTPAEEAAGGKVYMAARGAFDGLTCAMMAHPGNRDVAVSYALACLELNVEYHGKAAHAAARPEAGLNALDAMVAAFVNIGLLRQQLRDSARVHGIITDGGQAVNVIPHHTAASLLLRAEEDAYLDDVLKGKVLDCFQAAAQATGCRLEHRWGEESRYKAMRTNRACAAAYQANIESLGRTVMEPESRRSMGSTDMGNVSAIVPAIHPSVAVAPPDIPIHTEAFRDLAATEAGHRALLDSAKALAMTAVDVLTDAGLRERMKREFEGGE
ncbi:MAG TPA: M20 family metallopeptidase [Dehalococcoidia bacterium]|nr:M20 family metallopeptidase [Dehalococcoidia bacterium]